MAVLLQNTCAGLINGSTPSAAGTGGSSGDAFNTVAKAAGSVLEGSSAHPIQGSMGLHISAAASEGNYVEWVFTADDTAAARCGVIMDSTGTVTNDQALIAFRSTAGTMATLVIDPDAGTGGTADRFKIVNAVGADGATGAVDIPWVFTNKIFVEFWVTKGTTTSNGSGQFRWYVGSTLQETITTKLGNWNTGTVQVTRVRFGRSTTPASVCEYWLGAFALQTAAVAYIGLPAAAALTLNLTQGVKYFIDASASVAGAGGALTYSISRDSGPTVVPQQVSLGVWVVEQDPTLEIAYTVEVDEAGNSFDTIAVTVPPLATGTASVNETEELIYTAGVWV